ncbi:MAG: phosphatase PAP2 family protein [Oscillibacter sp.]
MQALEFAILNWIQLHLRCAFLDAVTPAFSRLCAHGELWIVLAICLLAVRRSRRTGLAVSCGLALDFLACNVWLKPLVGRIRPYEVNTAIQLLVPRLADFSFPSGHTAVSFAATAALKASGSRWWLPALAVSILMGLSRLYLYVHWPSDVLFGAVLGWLCGWAGWKLTELLAKWRRKTP